MSEWSTAGNYSYTFNYVMEWIITDTFNFLV